jgi:hypothetical protein
MKNLMLGAGIVGLGASVLLGGCLGGEDDAPVTDEATRAEAELGVAPRVDRFAAAVGHYALPSNIPAHDGLAASVDPGVVTVVRAQFDPAVFRDAASFRAKLEVK